MLDQSSRGLLKPGHTPLVNGKKEFNSILTITSLLSFFFYLILYITLLQITCTTITYIYFIIRCK